MKNTDHVYFIAEVGQNHNGDIELAHRLIEMASMPIFHEGKQLPGVDAVKFVKRDLDHEMTRSAYNAPYHSPHAFGDTYGKHREALELTVEQHFELYQDAKARGLDFIETACAPTVVDDLMRLFVPDAWKVASRDADNMPLINAMAETGVQMIISTGMMPEEDTEAMLDLLSGKGIYPLMMHCTSEYPARYEDIDLGILARLADVYVYRFGYSDHTSGILAPALSVIAGATLIEKHITLDRSMKGTDHAGSLGPDGLQRCVRDVRDAELAWRSESRREQSYQKAAAKLRRSVCSSCKITGGEPIMWEMLEPLSPGTGIPWSDAHLLIGMTARHDIEAQELIPKEWLYDNLY